VPEALASVAEREVALALGQGFSGTSRNAILIALGELDELARDRPIVAVCRASSRSAQATVILREAGFGDVVNLVGGMLRWRAEGHAVEDCSPGDPVDWRAALSSKSRPD
jgi:rhodanese-related sulfurtransferase